MAQTKRPLGDQRHGSVGIVSDRDRYGNGRGFSDPYLGATRGSFPIHEISRTALDLGIKG
jgi:5-formyltetrahydrofolate cyclo-ligase